MHMGAVVCAQGDGVHTGVWVGVLSHGCARLFALLPCVFSCMADTWHSHGSVWLLPDLSMVFCVVCEWLFQSFGMLFQLLASRIEKLLIGMCISNANLLAVGAFRHLFLVFLASFL